MYAHRTPLFGDTAAPPRDPSRLPTGELEAIEQRARGVGASYIHVPTVLELARRDVPALLAEVRRLRACREELREASVCAGA